jgi:hypothetical protein
VNFILGKVVNSLSKTILFVVKNSSSSAKGRALRV